MLKHLSALETDGTTFGMDVEASSTAYKNFKKAIKTETCISVSGYEFKARVVPYLSLAAIMKEAHWLVSELKSFVKVWIDDEEIYVKYGNEPIDFRRNK